MGKITFGGNITYGDEKYLSKYSKLFLEIIKDYDFEFMNYLEEGNDTYVIPIEKNNISNKFKNSYFIYWEDGIRNYCDRYIRIEKGSGLNIGYILSSDVYIDLFISEKDFEKNTKLIDENIMDWTTNKTSFSNSKFVTKYKFLQKYLFWTGGETGLPNHLIIEFHLKITEKVYDLIKEFIQVGNNLKKLNKLTKKFELNN